MKWIKLPGLPPPFWHNSYIAAIVNSFVIFLDTDARTQACTIMKYARVCVEVDVTRKMPDKVRIALPNNKSFWQQIVLEGNWSYCSHCKMHGHDLLQCRKKNKSRQYVQKRKNEMIKATESNGEET